MKPCVDLEKHSLAESEQQTLTNVDIEFVRHFQRRIELLSKRRVSLITFALPYAIILVAFSD